MYIFFLYVIYTKRFATSNPHKNKRKRRKKKKKTSQTTIFFYSIALAIIHKDMLTR